MNDDLSSAQVLQHFLERLQHVGIYSRTLRTLLVHVLLIGLARNTVSMVLRAVIVCVGDPEGLTRLFHHIQRRLRRYRSGSFVGKVSACCDFNGGTDGRNHVINTVRFGSVLPQRISSGVVSRG